MSPLVDPPSGERPLPRQPLGQSVEVQAIRETTRVGELIKRALSGELPRDRSPHAWEPSILTPLHINMVLDRAGGFQLKEIAERWEYTTVQVANVLGHPDAQTILSTILAIQASALTSIEERFRVLAPEAVNVKVEIMRDPAANPAVRDRVASDILDRAGYAPRKREEITHRHQILLPAQAATGLKEILQESRRVALVDYSEFLQKPDAEVTAGHLLVGAVGHLEPVDGASPVAADGPGEHTQENAA